MKTIRSFLIAAIVSLVLGVALLSTFIAYGFARFTAMDIIYENLMSLADAVSSYIAAEIEKEMTVLHALAVSAAMTSTTMTLEEKAEYLIPYIGLDSSRINYTPTDAQGNGVTTDMLPLELGDREYFKQVMQGASVVTDPLLSRSRQGVMTFMYAVPIRDRETGAVMGSLILTKDARFLSGLLAEIPIGQSGGPYVVSNGTGDTVAHYNSFSAIGENIEQLAATDSSLRELASFNAAIRSGGQGVGQYAYGGTTYLAAYEQLASDHCDWSVACIAPISEFTQGITTMLVLMIIAAFILCAGGIVVAVFIAGRIARPLSIVCDSLESIANGGGDLTVRLEERGNDEISAISRSFNKFVATLSSMVGNVSKSASSMSAIGQTLSAHVSGISGRVSSITEDIESLNFEADGQSASVTETSSAITQIAQTIETLSNEIERQSTAVTESSAAVHEMVSSINSISANASRAASSFDELKSDAASGKESITNVQELVQSLASQSDALLEANSVIESIAAQTNLLAMNAAIEAAHAGGAGKGFAVVAEEIRALAENSAEQSRAIASVLKEAVKAFGNIATVAGVADSSFDSVSAKIDSVTSLVAEINFSMAEQSAGSRQVLEGLQDIETVTAQIRDGAVEMNSGAAAILKEMNRLSNVSQALQERSASIAGAAEAINGALAEIRSDSGSNSDAISTLVSMTEKFKL